MSDSKRYVMFMNESGTKAEYVEFKWPGEESSSPDESLRPIGIVYDHDYTVYGDKRHGNIVGKPISGNPEVSDLVGKLLTIADALFVDKEQREAFKSLVRSTVYGYSNEKEDQVRQAYAVASGQALNNVKAKI